MSNRIDPATGEAKQFGEKVHQVIDEISQTTTSGGSVAVMVHLS